jgi:hypothetical protein
MRLLLSIALLAAAAMFHVNRAQGIGGFCERNKACSDRNGTPKNRGPVGDEAPGPQSNSSALPQKSAGRPEAAGLFVSEMSADVADAFLLARLVVGLRLRRQL